MDHVMRQYYFACEFLWFALSAVDYLLEDISSPSLVQQYGMGCAKFDDLAAWLLDELQLIAEHESLDAENLKRIRSQVEEIVLEWVNEVRMTVHNMENVCTLDEETRLYYLTCGWSLRILLEADHLLKGIGSVELRQRYREACVRAENLSKWLQDELSSAGKREGIDEGTAGALHAVIEALAEKLATEWREKVHEMSRDVNNKL